MNRPAFWGMGRDEQPDGSPLVPPDVDANPLGNPRNQLFRRSRIGVSLDLSPDAWIVGQPQAMRAAPQSGHRMNRNSLPMYLL